MRPKVRISSDEAYLVEIAICDELQKANMLASLNRFDAASVAFDKAKQIYMEVFSQEDDLPSKFINTASDFLSRASSFALPSKTLAQPQTDEAPPEIRGLWHLIWKVVTIGG